MYSFPKLAVTSLSLASSFACGPVPAQGIPTYDNVANTLSTINWQLQLLDNAEDALSQLEQIEHMVQGLRLVTGDRGFGVMLRNVGLDRYIPADALNIIDTVGTQGFGGMSPAGRAMRGTGLPDPCVGMPQAMHVACQAGIARPYEQAVLLRQIKAQQDSRITQLRGLLDAISSATDPAQREQLTARLVGEQAALTQAEGQAATLRAIAENERLVEEARRREATLNNLSRPGGLQMDVEP
jgi:type IV secretion system protein VirB5